MSTEPTDLAPHVDADWVDAFVVELRLRDVPGDAIGDALLEVESHVVDSGTPARDTFGDPVAYAAQVAQTAARPEPDDLRGVGPTLLGCVGLVLTLTGVLGGLDDGTAEITGSVLAVLVGVSLLVVVMTRFGTPMLRFVLGGVWRAVALFVAANAVVAALAVAARSWHLANLPAVPVVVAGLAVMGVAALLERRRPGVVDPIVPPGGDRTAAQESARRDARKVMLRVTGLQIAYVAAVVAAVVVVTRLG